MIKKMLTIALVFTLSLTLLLGLSACNSAEEATGTKENLSIKTDSSDSSDVTDTAFEESLITISKKAADKLEVLIDKKGYSEDVFLRIDTVRGIGWGGPRFKVVLDESTNEEDTVLEYDGMKIVYKAKYEKYIANTEIDYSDRFLSRGFILNNQPPSGC